MSNDNQFAASQDELIDLERRFGALLDNENILWATDRLYPDDGNAHDKDPEEMKL